MYSRREILKMGMAGAFVMFARPALSQSELVFPDGFDLSIIKEPSPPVTPFKDPLFIMPAAVPVRRKDLKEPIIENAHQRWNEFEPVDYYIQRLREFKWRYHSDRPYNGGTWGWGFVDNKGGSPITPGPTFYTEYGRPVFVRRYNDLPKVGKQKAAFALPMSSIHLHNAHTASESDGIPQNYVRPGEYWDHHYVQYRAGNDPRETLATLWYHDHMLDFTAPNVYAGLTGFYLYFDEYDSNNENDSNPNAFRLPSGKYDIPLILHDVQFDSQGQVVWDYFSPTPDPDNNNLPGPSYTINGMLGDRFTVNRIIQPHLEVERRKYRFRVLNGGPSRFYDLSLRRGNDLSDVEFYVISNDGNLLPEPILTDKINVSVAQRHDIIVDFSQFSPGEELYLVNRLEMREDGAGPNGRILDEGNLIMQFRVVDSNVEDNSLIPDTMRELPPIDLSEVRKERTFLFDYDNGLWTINGRLMEHWRIDAFIEQGSAEIWTLRNAGNAWSHPIHSHFEEFQILEKNGRPIPPGDVLKSRKDVMTIGPNEEVKIFMRWRDFLGMHVMHCHNVVHEDHAMMINWKIVPPGQGD